MKKIFLSILFSLFFVSVFAQIETTTSKDCYLLYDYDGKEFASNKKIKAGSPITVYGEAEGMTPFYDFYEVQFKKIKGYLKENCITPNKEMQVLLKIKAEKLDAEKREIVKADSIQQAKAEIYFRNRCGKWYSYVKRKEVVIGMPENLIRDCLGSPESVNTSEYSFGTHSQYVYKDMYIYTTDGKVDAIQRTTYNTFSTQQR